MSGLVQMKMPRTIAAGVTRSHILALFVVLFILVLVAFRWNHWNILLKPGGLGVSDPNGSTQKTTLTVKLTSRSKELKNFRMKVRNQNLRRVALNHLKDNSLLLTIHSYLDNIETICKSRIRMGNIGDGGWEICDDIDVRPREPCLVYSFGINYDFSFDDDVASVYGCHVYSFDPSMYDVPDRYNRSNLVHFYKIGLFHKTVLQYPGGDKELWQMNTLSGIREMLGHSKITIDVLKMDLELGEWQVLREMTSSGQLSTVMQLMIAFHVVSKRPADILQWLLVVQEVEKAGFMRYHAHKDPLCEIDIEGYPVTRTQCYEVHFIRRKTN